MLHQSCTVFLRMLDWFSVSALCTYPHISLEKNMAIAQNEEKGYSFFRKTRRLVDRVTHLPVSLQQFHVNTQIFCVQVQFEIADRIVTIQLYSPSGPSQEAGARTGKEIRNQSVFILFKYIKTKVPIRSKGKPYHVKRWSSCSVIHHRTIKSFNASNKFTSTNYKISICIIHLYCRIKPGQTKTDKIYSHVQSQDLNKQQNICPKRGVIN